MSNKKTVITWNRNISHEEKYYYIFSHLAVEAGDKWNLSKKEVNILSLYYNYNNDLKNEILNRKDRMNVLFSKDYKERIMKKVGCKYPTIAGALTKFRKLNIIKDRDLNKSLEAEIDNKHISVTINYEETEH